MTFDEQLEEAFRGRFRLRWSLKRQEYHLEQRVHTGQVMEPPSDERGVYDTYDDGYIRARDGYVYVMTIRSGTKMPCPICGLTVDVPALETRESTCENCKNHERDGRYIAAYFPLNHLLIEHLRFIDPETDGVNRVRARIRGRQLARIDRDKKEEMDNADYSVIFNTNQIEDRPMVGYGQKTAQRGDGSRFD